MKKLKKHLKPICLFLAFIVTFQGCTIYKQQNISLEEAVNLQGVKTKKKVKVVTLDNETQKYSYIFAVNDAYYGVKKTPYKQTQTLQHPKLHPCSVL